MQCLQCKKEFQAVRATAKFCSVYCRIAYSRSVSKVSVSSPINDTLKVSVSKGEVIADKPELSRTIIADKQMSEINKSDKIIADKPEQPIPEQKADDLSKLTAEELYAQIDSFKGGNE